MTAFRRLQDVVPRTPSDVRERDNLHGLHLPPPRSSIADQAPYSRMIFPPRIEKLPSSSDFSVNDFAMTLGAGNGSFVTSANLRFELPGDSVGWLQQYQFYILTPTALANVQFAIRINEGPVPGFVKVVPPGVANFVVLEGNDLRVRAPMGSVIDIIVTNLAASGPWTVGGMLAGWYHSEAEEQRIFGSYY